MSMQKAKARLTNKVLESARQNGGHPGEADTAVNNACRRVVEEMAAEHGEAWLGKINLYGKEHGTHPIMWKWDGLPVCNFECAFVAPKYDEELVRLIRERDEVKEYPGAAVDGKRVLVIMDRMEAIGGICLYWT